MEKTAREEIQFAIGESSLGFILMALSETGLCAVLIGNNQKKLIKELQTRFPNANFNQNGSKVIKLLPQLLRCAENPRQNVDFPLDQRGTPFQKSVWNALRKIPPGKTLSYRDVAIAIGLPKTARAVALACAANPIAVIVPCHRVVRSDGSLSGYRWGVEIKRSLLERESC